MDMIRKLGFVIYIVIPLVTAFIFRLFKLAQGEKHEEIVSGIMVGILIDLFIAIILLITKIHKR